MEILKLKEFLLSELIQKQKYLLNIKQNGEALELLNSLGDNSASLVFLDPQYEPVKNVTNFRRILQEASANLNAPETAPSRSTNKINIY